MYKNQYFIINKRLIDSHGLKVITFDNLNIYAHPSLNISLAKYQTIEVLLLGYIMNPLKPQETNDGIVYNLAERCNTRESLFKEVQLLSGRFIILYKNEFDLVAVNDACALKQLYYGFLDKDVILTSSPRMFIDLYGSELEISDIKQDFINSEEYRNNEFQWIGDKCIDNRLLKVLPNHYLDVNGKKACRTPIYSEELASEQDSIEYAAAVLQGSFDSITRRFQVVQALTGGWDSRVLLAASKKYRDDIQFFVFDFSGIKSDAIHFDISDVRIPEKLSARLGLNFQVIKPDELKEDFLAAYRREHIFPRISPSTAEIQYQYFKRSNKNVIRVSGVGAEITRCKHGYTNHKIDANMLKYLSGYSRKSEYANHEIDDWLRDVRKYSEEYNISILDLMHWEQKIGNWGALYAFEQDIAVEELRPFCNKNLLLSILRINPKKRSSPHYTFFYNLIKYLWEDTLAEPMNPGGFIKYLRRVAKRNSVIKYYKLRAKFILKSFKKRIHLSL